MADNRVRKAQKQADGTIMTNKSGGTAPSSAAPTTSPLQTTNSQPTNAITGQNDINNNSNPYTTSTTNPAISPLKTASQTVTPPKTTSPLVGANSVAANADANRKYDTA